MVSRTDMIEGVYKPKPELYIGMGFFIDTQISKEEAIKRELSQLFDELGEYSKKHELTLEDLKNIELILKRILFLLQQDSRYSNLIPKIESDLQKTSFTIKRLEQLRIINELVKQGKFDEALSIINNLIAEARVLGAVKQLAELEKDKKILLQQKAIYDLEQKLKETMDKVNQIPSDQINLNNYKYVVSLLNQFYNYAKSVISQNGLNLPGLLDDITLLTKEVEYMAYFNTTLKQYNELVKVGKEKETLPLLEKLREYVDNLIAIYNRFIEVSSEPGAFVSRDAIEKRKQLMTENAVVLTRSELHIKGIVYFNDSLNYISSLMDQGKYSEALSFINNTLVPRLVKDGVIEQGSVKIPLENPVSPSSISAYLSDLGSYIHYLKQAIEAQQNGDLKTASSLLRKASGFVRALGGDPTKLLQWAEAFESLANVQSPHLHQKVVGNEYCRNSE